MRLSNITNTPWKVSRNKKESSQRTNFQRPHQHKAKYKSMLKSQSVKQQFYSDIKNIAKSIIALKMKFIMIVSVLVALCTADMVIHPKYCIVKNCYNCARVFNHNFGTKEQRYVCQSMLRQKGCCDFYNRKSKGILF